MQGPVEDVGEAAEEEQEYGAQEDAVEPRVRVLGAARHPDEERKPGHAGHAGQGQQPRDASHVVPWAGGQAHALAQQAAGVGGQQHGRRGQGPDQAADDARRVSGAAAPVAGGEDVGDAALGAEGGQQPEPRGEGNKVTAK